MAAEIVVAVESVRPVLGYEERASRWTGGTATNREAKDEDGSRVAPRAGHIVGECPLPTGPEAGACYSWTSCEFPEVARLVVS